MSIVNRIQYLFLYMYREYTITIYDIRIIPVAYTPLQPYFEKIPQKLKKYILNPEANPFFV